MATKKKANTARKRLPKRLAVAHSQPITKTLEQEIRELRADVAHWKKIANAALDKGNQKRAANGSRSLPTSKIALERQICELRGELAIIKRIAQAAIEGEL